MRAIIIFIALLGSSVKANDMLHAPPIPPVPMMPEKYIQCNELTERHLERLSNWSAYIFKQSNERIALHRLNSVIDLIEIRKASQIEDNGKSIKLIDEKLLSIFTSIYVDSTYYLMNDRNEAKLNNIRAYFKNNSSISTELTSASEVFFRQLHKLYEES